MYSKLVAILLAVVGGFAIGGIALLRDEQINSLWIVTAAVCIYVLGYRFYAKWIETRIYVVEGGKKVAEGEGSHITRVIDADGDGLDELVVTSGGIGQGVLEETARMLGVAGEKVRVIEDFGSVILDDCGTRLPGAASKVTRIVAVPKDGKYSFERKQTSQPCDID